MQIETAHRQQRLDRCASTILASDEDSAFKAESILFIAGCAAILKGVEVAGATIDEPEVVEAVVTIDDFCDLVENAAKVA